MMKKNKELDEEVALFWPCYAIREVKKRENKQKLIMLTILRLMLMLMMLMTLLQFMQK